MEVSDTSDVPGRAVGQDEGLPAWARSVPVPEGYRVTAVRADDDPVPSVEVDLVGPHGVVVVTQRLARLDLAPSDGLDVPAEPGSVTVLSAAPWHAVWQSGDVMVDVVAEVPSTAVADLVVAAPVQEYDDRPQARVVRGWQNLIESWSNL